MTGIEIAGLVLPDLVAALLTVDGGADLLVGGPTESRVVVADNPVVRPPLLHPLTDLRHHPQELLRLQGGLAASQDPAEVEGQHYQQGGVMAPHSSLLSPLNCYLLIRPADSRLTPGPNHLTFPARCQGGRSHLHLLLAGGE